MPDCTHVFPCPDIDECATEGSSPCDLSTEQCHNLVGTFVCKCQTGLVKEGGKCVPKNEQEKESIKGKKTAQKKKKKRAKKGSGAVEPGRRYYPWYYTIAPLTLLVLTFKYAQPTLATSLALLVVLALPVLL